VTGAPKNSLLHILLHLALLQAIFRLLMLTVPLLLLKMILSPR
jgi:hypothetical protein